MLGIRKQLLSLLPLLFIVGCKPAGEVRINEHLTGPTQLIELTAIPQNASRMQLLYSITPKANITTWEQSLAYVVSENSLTTAKNTGQFFLPKNSISSVSSGDFKRWRLDINRGDLLVDTTTHHLLRDTLLSKDFNTPFYRNDDDVKKSQLAASGHIYITWSLAIYDEDNKFIALLPVTQSSNYINTRLAINPGELPITVADGMITFNYVPQDPKGFNFYYGLTTAADQASWVSRVESLRNSQELNTFQNNNALFGAQDSHGPLNMTNDVFSFGKPFSMAQGMFVGGQPIRLYRYEGANNLMGNKQFTEGSFNLDDYDISIFQSLNNNSTTLVLMWVVSYKDTDGNLIVKVANSEINDIYVRTINGLQ